MSLDDFERVVLSWHDFYLATAGGAAALLGLLFVAVSLNLDDIAHAQRLDLRVLAEQSFSNFLFALVVALFLLVPTPFLNPASAEGMLVGVGAVGLFRIARRGARTVRHRELTWGAIYTARRLGAPAWANVCLILAAILLTNADLGAFYWLLAAIFVFLLSAADASWDLLVRVGAERQAEQGAASPGTSGDRPSTR